MFVVFNKAQKAKMKRESTSVNYNVSYQQHTVNKARKNSFCLYILLVVTHLSYFSQHHSRSRLGRTKYIWYFFISIVLVRAIRREGEERSEPSCSFEIGIILKISYIVRVFLTITLGSESAKCKVLEEYQNIDLRLQ